MYPQQRKFPIWLVSLILAGLTMAVYWPARTHDFVSYDDPDYVMSNEMVTRGLTWEGCQQAFSTYHAGNWHPLTWISHMLDVQWFGLNPGGHHVTNILLHAINTVLLLGWLFSATGSPWRSTLVAALFAFHPLHVDSVAWIAERKDVLSTCFGLLTLLAYAAYVRAKGEGREARGGTTPHPIAAMNPSTPNPSQEGSTGKRFWYAMALGCFACGLMSKPMLVTWPFVLLLLDYWPLQRFRLPAKLFSNETWRQNRPLFLEKIPFLLLTIASCLITYAAQSDADAVSEIPTSTRLANALLAHGLYILKIFVPTKLAVFYPIPEHHSALQLAGIGLGLAALSIGCLRYGRTYPALLVGWLFFLGTLFPVSGIAVQVGQQLMADRYTYVPAIGIFIMVSWGIGSVVAMRPQFALPVTATLGLVVFGLMALTRAQLATWKNTFTLYEHALRVTQNNYVAHNNLAAELYQAGRKAEAGEHAREALRLKPNYPDAHVNYANELIRLGRKDEARAHLEEAMRLKPNQGTEYNLAITLMEMGDLDVAEAHYRNVLQKQPGHVFARQNLGICLLKMGRTDEAISEFKLVLAAQPDNSSARLNLSSALASQNRIEDATAVLIEQIRLRPDDTDARFNLANLWQQMGRNSEARAQFEAVLKLNPTDVAARQGLGLALAQSGQVNAAAAQLQQALQYSTNATLYYQLGLVQMMQTDFTNAIASWQQALALEPNAPMALNDLAWLLATCPDPRLRQPAPALQHALRACELTGRKVSRFLGTLDAAYAANGQFDEAIATAKEVIARAEKNGETEIADLAKERLVLYQQGRPYSQVLPNQAGPTPQTQ